MDKQRARPRGVALWAGDGPVPLMRRFLLIASAIMLVLGAFTSNPPASASDDIGVWPEASDQQAPLSAAVTAQGRVTRAYSWSVDKAADATIRPTRTTGTATFRYTVTARAVAMTESGWELEGVVTVANPNEGEEDAIAADVAVSTTLGGGSSCAVVGGGGVVVPPSGELSLPYACSFTSAPAAAGTVTATVGWDPDGEAADASVDASVPGSFAAASEANRTVAVVDDTTVRGQRVVLDPSLTWSPGLVKAYTYDLALRGGAPGSCTPYVNTATLDQPSGTDPSASTTVQACTPEVLPAQAYGQATGSVTAGCRGSVRARVSNRTDATVTYALRVGDRLHRIVVRSMGHRKLVTSGPALARVTLKTGGVRLDRIRIPQRCAPTPSGRRSHRS